MNEFFQRLLSISNAIPDPVQPGMDGVAGR